MFSRITPVTAGAFLALAALIIGFAVAQSAAAITPLHGDVDCSGAVTSMDVAIVVAAAAGQPQPPGCSNSVDLNCSGHISSVDISIAVLLAGGGSYSPPASCNQ